MTKERRSASIRHNTWKGGRVKKADSLVPLVASNIYDLVNKSKKNPQKVLQKVRDFPFFDDYIYDKGNMPNVIGF